MCLFSVKKFGQTDKYNDQLHNCTLGYIFNILTSM